MLYFVCLKSDFEDVFSGECDPNAGAENTKLAVRSGDLRCSPYSKRPAGVIGTPDREIRGERAT